MYTIHTKIPIVPFNTIQTYSKICTLQDQNINLLIIQTSNQYALISTNNSTIKQQGIFIIFDKLIIPKHSYASIIFLTRISIGKVQNIT